MPGHGAGRSRLLHRLPVRASVFRAPEMDEPRSVQASGQVVPLTHPHTCDAGVTIWWEGRPPA